MKCQKCVDANLKSTIYVPNGGVTTGMACESFYDENGAFHRHDPNTHSDSWSCSNGHRWHRSFQSICPVLDCEWNKTRENKIIWED